MAAEGRAALVKGGLQRKPRVEQVTFLGHWGLLPTTPKIATRTHISYAINHLIYAIVLVWFGFCLVLFPQELVLL